MKIILLLLFGLMRLWSGEIRVAVAANVSYAIEPIKAVFAKAHPDTKVTVLLGSSGKLTAQITNGAPFDLFLSANMKYPTALYEKGIAATKPVVYAEGAIALLSSSERDFGKGAVALLKDQSIGKIAIANPKTAPYGKAAMQMLEKADLLAVVKPKLIYAESITQAVQYTMTAADLGIIAASSLYSDKMKHFQQDKHYTRIDTTLYTPIKQGVVLLKHADNNEEASAFYDFLLGDEAKSIFKSYGYLVP